MGFHVNMASRSLAFACLVWSGVALAEPPPRPLGSFETAKKVARDAIYAGHNEDFYCGCSYDPWGRSGGKINLQSCGYVPRKSASRASRLEWEHMMPAYFFGHDRKCWTQGLPDCANAEGKIEHGRGCCAKADPEFAAIEGDLHNLVPSVGEANGDRSNMPYGEVEGEARAYGSCDFEIGGAPKVTEPRDKVRGDAARAWLYMSQTYNIAITPQRRAMYEQWSAADPPDEWERLRDSRVNAAQGNHNPYVTQ